MATTTTSSIPPLNSFLQISLQISSLFEHFVTPSVYQKSIQTLLRRLQILQSSLDTIYLSPSLPHNTSPPFLLSSPLQSLVEFSESLEELKEFLSTFQKPFPFDSLAVMIRWYRLLIIDLKIHLNQFQKSNNLIQQVMKDLQSTGHAAMTVAGSRNLNSHHDQIEDCENMKIDLESLFREVATFERTVSIPDPSLKLELLNLVEILSGVLAEWNEKSNEIKLSQHQLSIVSTFLSSSSSSQEIGENCTSSSITFQSNLIRMRHMLEDLTQSNCSYTQQMVLIDSLHQDIVNCIEETTQVQIEFLSIELEKIKHIAFEFHNEVMSTLQRNQDDLLVNLLNSISHHQNLDYSSLQQSLRQEKLHALEIYSSQLELKQQEILGRGSFGEVCVGQYGNRPVAVKIVRSKHISLNKKEKLAIENESLLMSLCHHPTVLQIYGYCYPDSRTAYIIMELCSSGSLWSYLTLRPQEISINLSFAWMSDLFSALSHLHHHKIVHRDVKPENILLTPPPHLHCKLTDFGLSKQLESISGCSVSSTSSGSLFYMAPEVRLQRRHTHRSDVYSAGITSYQLLSRSTTFPEGVKQRILTHVSTFDQSVQDLFLGCLADESSDRISSSEAFKMIVFIQQQQYEDPRMTFVNMTTSPTVVTPLTPPSDLRNWLETLLSKFAVLAGLML
jgi:hypothetical protein